MADYAATDATVLVLDETVSPAWDVTYVTTMVFGETVSPAWDVTDQFNASTDEDV